MWCETAFGGGGGNLANTDYCFTQQSFITVITALTCYVIEKTVTYQLCFVWVMHSLVAIVEITTRGESDQISEDG